jgi:hypothetical protein
LAKATSLSPETLSSSIAVPAATTPRAPRPAKAPAQKTMPLQIRIPRQEVKAIKVAAAQAEQTISEFMLACFHLRMKSGEHA